MPNKMAYETPRLKYFLLYAFLKKKKKKEIHLIATVSADFYTVIFVTLLIHLREEI